MVNKTRLSKSTRAVPLQSQVPKNIQFSELHTYDIITTKEVEQGRRKYEMLAMAHVRTKERTNKLR